MKKFSIASAAACLVVSGGVYAADDTAPQLAEGFHPNIKVMEKRDSNVTRDPITAISSNVLVVNPSLLLKGASGANDFSAFYEAEGGRYASSSADNYTDHKLTATANLNFSSRSALTITPEYLKDHDDRGSVAGAAATATPNKYTNTSLRGSYMYGVEDARGRVKFDLGQADRGYDNNRTATTAYDRKTTDMGGTFYLRVAPKTSAFFEATNSKIAYKDPLSTLSGQERGYRVGVEWDITALTSGSFKIGQLQKKFDNTAAHPNSNKTSWIGNAHWTPRTFVNVDFTTSQTATESSGLGNYVLVGNNLLNVGYNVTERALVGVNLGTVSEEFVNAGRKDNTNKYGIKAEYKFRHWLIGNVEYSNDRKTSNVVNGGYNRNVFAIGLRTEL